MPGDYVTTNVRLPASQHRALKHRAVTEGKSMSQVIRESVAEYLAGPGDALAIPEGLTRDEWESDSLWLIGSDPVKQPTADGAVHHDDHLYGSDERDVG
jgi:hypothetical protein